MIRKTIQKLAVILIVVYIFLLSAVSVFCSEPHGEPTWVEWENNKQMGE